MSEARRETIKLRNRLVNLLNNYNANLKKLAKLQSDHVIKEWEQDYRARRMSGGMRSVSVPIHYSEGGIPQSVQERLILEEERIVEKLYGLKLSIQLTNLLLIHLEKEERALIEANYFECQSIDEICSRFYISRSTYYRKLHMVLDKMLVTLGKIIEDDLDYSSRMISQREEGE